MSVENGMNAGELNALAERVKAATGPDQFRVITEAGMAVWGWHDPRFKRLLRLCEEGAFLDAAMTLVPEGSRVILNIAEDGITTAIVAGTQGVADTPALALTAACLRACASLTEAPSNAWDWK